MSGANNHKSEAKNRRWMPWRGTICLLLAVLFLYNPFLNMAASANGLAVAHRDSNRSTVGSGEFQHFTPTDSQDNSVPKIAVVRFWRLNILLSVVSYIPQFDPQPRAHWILFAELWFRPPPAVR